MTKKGVTPEEFMSIASTFPKDVLIDAVRMMAEVIGEKEYGKSTIGDKRIGAVRFLAEFSLAGIEKLTEDGVIKEDDDMNDYFEYICPECKDRQSTIERCVQNITDSIEEIADVLAPDDIRGQDKFIFGVSILQDMVDCADSALVKSKDLFECLS